MEAEIAQDGSADSQLPPEGGGEGQGMGESAAQSDSDRVAGLEAKLDMLADNFAELRGALAQRQPAVPEADPYEDLDDETPLTAKQVSKVIDRSLNRVVETNNQAQSRKEWDEKAKSEFPLHDPQFQRKLREVWKEQVVMGLDSRHPAAAYNVAKMTAQIMGVKKPQARKNPDTTHTAEAPSSGTTPRRSTSPASKIDDSDPRVSFYNMRGDKTKEQIARFKEKLAEKDAKLERRRR